MAKQIIRDKKGRIIEGAPQDTNKNGTAGRPSSVTQIILERLRMAFAVGATDEEACIYAKISPATLYNYQDEHPEFLEEKELLKLNPVLTARNNVVEAMQKQENETEAQKQTRLETSKWYLQRKKKDEFSNLLIDVKQDNRSIQIVKDDPRVLETLTKAYQAMLENARKLSDEQRDE